MSKHLGAKLRQLRKDRMGLSLRELAKRVGISSAFLSDIELGRRNPSHKTTLALANELGTTVDWLEYYDQRALLKKIKIMVNDEIYRDKLWKFVRSGEVGDENNNRK